MLKGRVHNGPVGVPPQHRGPGFHARAATRALFLRSARDDNVVVLYKKKTVTSSSSSSKTRTDVKAQLDGGNPPSSPNAWSFPVFPDIGSYAASLVSGLLQWNDEQPDKGADVPLQEAEQVLQEASNKEKELQGKAAPADISQFLSPVPVWELKHIRKLSHLCAISYKLPTVTQRALKRKHGLDLVAASWTCNDQIVALLEETIDSPDEVAAAGDGMAVTLSDIRSHYRPPVESSKASPLPPALIPPISPPPLLSNIVPVPNNAGSSSGSTSSGSSGSDDSDGEEGSMASSSSAPPSSAATSPASLLPPPQQQRKWLSPTDLVAAKLAEAAAAASAAAGGPLAEAANNLYSGFTSSLPMASARARAGNVQGTSQAGRSNGSGSGSVQGAGPAAASPAATDAERSWQQRQQQQAVLRAAAQMALASKQPSNPGPSSSGAAKALWSLPTPPGWPSSTPKQQPSLQLPAPSASPLQAPALATVDREGMACPSEWFVCDDVANHTRIFVIQGSDTLDHWKLNITFDPVVFEDPALGVKVHRGVYEAAQYLYKRFLPLVYEAIDSSPCTKICFTGHSVGGSLGTLLALMFRHRGVLPLDRLATLYTFGAPAVFCECGSGPEGCCGEDAAPQPPLPSTSRDQAQAAAAQHASGARPLQPGPIPSPASSASAKGQPAAAHVRGGSRGGVEGGGCGSDAAGCHCEDGGDSKGVLGMLGLPTSLVRNVIMSRDIVPRAFACDYSLVADILKSWGQSFKDHGCLAREGRKHLYYFIGHMMVLQPDGDFHWFVSSNEPDHPMLPPGPNMFLLGPPRPPPAAKQQQQQQQQQQPLSQQAGRPSSGDRTGGVATGSSSAGRDGSRQGSSSTGRDGSREGSSRSTRSSTQGSSEVESSSRRSSSPGVSRSSRSGSPPFSFPLLSLSPPSSPSGSRSNSPTRSSSSSSSSSSSRGSRSSSPGSVQLPGFPVQLPLPQLPSLIPPMASSPPLPTTPAVAPMAVAEQKRAQQLQQVPVRTHNDAVNALMDNPHPLDILADPGAYLSFGSISRYHNPDNYTAALGRLIFLKRKHEGRFPSWVSQAYSRMLRMEAEARGGSDWRQEVQQRPYMSTWDGTEMDAENPAEAARRPLEVHHW